MYSICYVLTDNDKLLYYNQLLISLSSLQNKEFPGDVLIMMDSLTAEILNRNHRTEIPKLGGRVIILDISNEFSQKEKSRYIKTSIREHIQGDFLFVDTDTIFADKLPEEGINCELGIVREQYQLLEDSFYRDFFPDVFSCSSGKTDIYGLCGYDRKKMDIIYNSGVIWAKDTELVHAFFQQWHEEWKLGRAKGVLYDQPTLNGINKRLDNFITELDGRWNVQVSRPIAQKYLESAIILHYFNGWPSGGAYMLCWRRIQEQGYQSDVVRHIIADPKKAFLPFDFFIKDGATEEIIHLNAFSFLRNLYRNHRLIFRAFNYVVSIPDRISKRINIGNGKR